MLPLFLWLFQAAPKVIPPAPAVEKVEYEICYHHTLRNRTRETLKEVIVYLPVPQSDEYQTVSDFPVERDRPVHISNREDAYGTEIKRVAIAKLEPGAEVDVGFSCIVDSVLRSRSCWIPPRPARRCRRSSRGTRSTTPSSGWAPR